MSFLGASITAKVEMALCRRIALARKTVRCTRLWTITDALQEVMHLQNLRHRHIIQLVGTYLRGREFAILMYPVADCHLGLFLQDTSDLSHLTERDWAVKLQISARDSFLPTIMPCLSSAIRYVHENTTKHMDIKPQNILIKSNGALNPLFTVYLADFGLSRSFAEQGNSQTDGPTARTPRYCAPEVYASEARGRASDIFSLGCVFSEVLTVIARQDLDEFADHRRGDGDDDAFHTNLEKVSSWLAQFSRNHRLCSFEFSVVTLVEKMLHNKPSKRPTASQIDNHFYSLSDYNDFQKLKDCCHRGPEPYVEYLACR